MDEFHITHFLPGRNALRQNALLGINALPFLLLSSPLSSNLLFYIHTRAFSCHRHAEGDGNPVEDSVSVRRVGEAESRVGSPPQLTVAVSVNKML